MEYVATPPTPAHNRGNAQSRHKWGWQRHVSVGGLMWAPNACLSLTEGVAGEGCWSY